MIPLAMRRRWGCPDLGDPAAYAQPIPDSDHEFPDCPAAYLRDAHTIAWLKDHGVENPMDEHLVDGVTHPASLIGEVVFELESGSRNIGQCSPLVRSLAHLWMNERNARDEKRRERNRAKANG